MDRVHTYARRQRRIYTILSLYVHVEREIIKFCSIDSSLWQRSWWSSESCEDNIRIGSTSCHIRGGDVHCADDTMRCHFIVNYEPLNDLRA